MTRHEETRTSIVVASMSSTASKPDIYGQLHPNETPYLISQQLIAFQEEIERLPAETKVALQQAQSNCPELLTDEFHVMFLRSEVYNADVRTIPYVCVWISTWLGLLYCFANMERKVFFFSLWLIFCFS
jgi:hypothetical protein